MSKPFCRHAIYSRDGRYGTWCRRTRGHVGDHLDWAGPARIGWTDAGIVTERRGVILDQPNPGDQLSVGVRSV